MDSIKKITKKDLLYNNLLLLGLKPEETIKTSKIEITKDCLDKENPKAVYLILFFLLQLMITEEELMTIKLSYPPRNLSERIEFINLVFKLLQKLEHDRKVFQVPKNFIVGKSVLEITGGDQIISFLRFFSELCLKHHMANLYPAAKIPVIKLSFPRRRFADPNDINEYYSISSLLDEKAQIIDSISPERIRDAIQVCNLHIRMYRKKFFKRANSFFEDYDEWKKKADFILSEYIRQRDSLEGLQARRNALKKDSDKKYFTEMRALDRIPQVDLCNEVNKMIQNVNATIKQQRIDLMLREFIDKADGRKITDILEISNFDTRSKEQEKSYILNDLLTKYKNSLEPLEKILNSQNTGGTTTKHIKSLDDLILKKKRNIEILREKRKEFIKILS